MLFIKNLTYYIGNRALYEDASVNIKDGEKIGLIGLNGTGKSTLLKIISGEKKIDSGKISVEKDAKIGFFNQDLLSYVTEESIRNVAMRAFDDLLKLKEEIDKLLAEMEKEYSDDLLKKLFCFIHKTFMRNFLLLYHYIGFK